MRTERMPASLGGAASHGYLLGMIRTADGLSRQQLLAATGMSRATLYERLDTLIRRGYVYEAEPLEATGGRRSRKIRFDDRGRVVLALALGQTHATVAVADTAGNPLRSITVRHEISDPAPTVLGPLTQAGQRLLEAAQGETLIGVGVSLPAPADTRSGKVTHPTTIPSWHEDAVIDAVGAIWNGPLLVENDARAAALGERANESETVVYVKVGTGIGCGIVVGGSILRGAHGASGDIGHILIAPDGPLCRCGRHGCLAAYSSGRAVADSLAARNFASLEDIRQAALTGDPEVRQVLDSAADTLGHALAATVATINPDRLVLGGQIGSIPEVVDRVRKRVLADVVDRISEGLVIEAGHADDMAAVRGLTAIVTTKVFDPELIDTSLADLAS